MNIIINGTLAVLALAAGASVGFFLGVAWVTLRMERRG